MLSERERERGREREKEGKGGRLSLLRTRAVVAAAAVVVRELLLLACSPVAQRHARLAQTDDWRERTTVSLSLFQESKPSWQSWPALQQVVVISHLQAASLRRRLLLREAEEQLRAKDNKQTSAHDEDTGGSRRQDRRSWSRSGRSSAVACVFCQKDAAPREEGANDKERRERILAMLLKARRRRRRICLRCLLCRREGSESGRGKENGGRERGRKGGSE